MRKFHTRKANPNEVKALKKGIMTPLGFYVALLPWKELKVDGGTTGYQRDCSAGGVNKIVLSFLWTAFRMLVVAQRKGTSDLYIIDGQHRRETLLKLLERGENVPDVIPCIVIPETSRAQEALFYTLMNSALPVNGNPRFKAMSKAGGFEAGMSLGSETLTKRVAEFVAVLDTVEAAGFSMEYRTPGSRTEANSSPNGLAGAGKLQKASELYGIEILAKALKLLRMGFAKGANNKPENVPLSHRKGEYVLALCHALWTDEHLAQNIGATASAIRERGIDLDNGMEVCAVKAVQAGYIYGKQSKARCLDLGKWLVERLTNAASATMKEAA